MRSAIILGLLAQWVTVMLILWEAWGAAKTFRAGAIVLILSLAAEVWGSQIGDPFGAYSYTDTLHPQLLGVPLLIPLG